MSTSYEHTLGNLGGIHHRTEDIEKHLDEEDHFSKTLIQKKQKLDPRIHKSTPTVVPARLCDSKRPFDQFNNRGVPIYIYK